jgi:hypothetical protein
MRRRYGLPQALVARLLDVSLRTVSGAESSGAVPPQRRRDFTQATPTSRRVLTAPGDANGSGFLSVYVRLIRGCYSWKANENPVPFARVKLGTYWFCWR